MLQFLVQGSAPQPYTVTFERNGADISARCSCPAGENGTHCKHRIRILLGDTQAIVSGNIPDALTVLSWVPGSSMETAIRDYEAAEAALESAQRNLSSAKRKLAVAMR